MPTPQAPAYASPATSGYLRRSARLADAMQQMQAKRDPGVFNSSAGTGMSILADALNAWNLDQQEAKGEAGLKADRAKLSDALLSGFGAAPAASNDQTDAQKAVAANMTPPVQSMPPTPGVGPQAMAAARPSLSQAMGSPAGGQSPDAALAAQVRNIAELTGDPLAALQYGQGREQQQLQNKLALQKANEPIALPAGASLVDPVTRQPIFTAPDHSRNEQKPDIKEGKNGNYWERDPSTGEWKDTGVPFPPPSGGVTINMPGNVREGVDANGNIVFGGIDPKNPGAGFQPIAGMTPPANLMGADTKAKFAALAPNAYAGIGQLEKLFGPGGDDPLDDGYDVAAQVFSALPFGIGEPVARGLGGQNWQDFDQAWNAIELGVHIPAGAAVSVTEAQRFLRANKPALNESSETKLRKIANVRRFYDGLAAGFKGDLSGLNGLLKSSGEEPAAPAAPATPGAPSTLQLPPGLTPDSMQMIEQLRQLGKSDQEIQAILNGQ